MRTRRTAGLAVSAMFLMILATFSTANAADRPGCSKSNVKNNESVNSRIFSFGGFFKMNNDNHCKKSKNYNGKSARETGNNPWLDRRSGFVEQILDYDDYEHIYRTNANKE